MDTMLLPDGTPFAAWEPGPGHGRDWIVDQAHAAGDDANEGSADAPLATIQAAVDRAQAGDLIIVKAGIYRETVRFGHGGEGPDAMLHLIADDGAVISGAEVIDPAWWQTSGGWHACQQVEATIWMTRLPRQWFIGEQPFACPNRAVSSSLGGFDQTKARNQPLLAIKRGLVFADDQQLEQVLDYTDLADGPGRFWVEPDGLAIHVRPYDDRHPGLSQFEVTARGAAIATNTDGLGYIRLTGLTVERCAHAFPFMPQEAAISICRGHHWVIEDCHVRDINAVGIEAGNGDPRRAPACDTEGQALTGHTIIRRNVVERCGICGIAGMRFVDGLIEDNLVQDCATYDIEEMFENAGIKTHCNVNSLVRRNLVRRIPHGCGLWLDFNNHNLRVTSNVVYDCESTAGGIFIEATHTPSEVDHNVVCDVREVANPPFYCDSGNGVYTQDTDRLHLHHNILVRCAGIGALLRKGQSDRFVTPPGGSSRGSCSRHHHLHDNVMIDCGRWLALAHPDSNLHDNHYAPARRGGPLRLLELDEWLDLADWQAFHRLDNGSKVRDLSADTIDGDMLTITGSVADLPEHELASIGAAGRLIVCLDPREQS